MATIIGHEAIGYSVTFVHVDHHTTEYYDTFWSAMTAIRAYLEDLAHAQDA